MRKLGFYDFKRAPDFYGEDEGGGQRGHQERESSRYDFPGVAASERGEAGGL